MKGLQSIMDEVSSPDSFYLDSFGALRRVTSSIFVERRNTAQREKARRQRQERFRARQEGANARRGVSRTMKCRFRAFLGGGGELLDFANIQQIEAAV